MFWRRKRSKYQVTVHCNGRHPYLEEHSRDLETQDVKVMVNARNWNDAARKGLDEVAQNRPDILAWSYWVTGIAKGQSTP